jgi:hypothetical protein
MILDANGDASGNAFAALLAQGLITTQQRVAALASLQTAALPLIPTPGHALAWMCVQGFTSEDALEATLERLEKELSTEAFTASEDTADESYDLLELGETGITHEAVRSLYDSGLIDAEARDAAFEEAPLTGSKPPALAATLAWMVTNGLIENTQFEATRARVAAELPFAMAAERKALVEEAARLIAAERAVTAQWKASASRRRRRSVWPLWLGLLAVVAGVAWYLLAPDATPSCDASSTNASLDDMMFRLQLDARLRSVGQSDKRIETPRVSAPHEIGYRKAERTRGCTALLTQGERQRPMAYTIGPSTQDDGKMVVREADPAIVEARFGHLDAEGRPLNNADPIGREALEQAFRAGVEGLSQSESAFDRLRRRMQQPGTGLVTTDSERERVIADIEPTGACHASDGGYACPLVIEYNDRLLGAIGGADRSTVLRGEFGLVQKDGSWQMADDFADSFGKAVMAGRMAALGLAGGSH